MSSALSGMKERLYSSSNSPYHSDSVGRMKNQTSKNVTLAQEMDTSSWTAGVGDVAHYKERYAADIADRQNADAILMPTHKELMKTLGCRSKAPMFTFTATHVALNKEILLHGVPLFSNQF